MSDRDVRPGQSTGLPPSEWLGERLRRACARPSDAGLPSEATDEELAALALGDLPPDRHAAAISCIADSPDVARLVAMVVDDPSWQPEVRLRGESPSRLEEPPRIRREFRGDHVLGRGARRLVVALAAAAVIALSLTAAIWFLEAPRGSRGLDPLMPTAASSADGESPSSPPSDDYWSRLGHEERVHEAAWQRILEYLLVSSVAATAVLSLVVCVLVLQRGHGAGAPKPSPPPSTPTTSRRGPSTPRSSSSGASLP